MNYQDNSSTPIKFTPSRDSNYRSNSGDVGTRPTGDPKSRKDFKKVLNTDSKDSDEEDKEPIEGVVEEDATAIAENDAKKAPPSLFELTSGKTTMRQPAFHSMQAAQQSPAGAKPIDAETQKPVQSPSSLFSQLSSTEAKKSTAADERIVVSLPSAKDDKFTTRFAIEQPDLSYVNPMMAIAKPIENVSITTEKPIAPTTNIQDIINQLVDKVQELKDNGKTETTITLKHPPLFAGAHIVVTSYDSAKGEFNLTFGNLTQTAKDLLDMRVNRETLLLDLEKKGYAVHIVTTSTIVESRPIIDAQQLSRDRQQEEGREQGREGRRQQKEEEET